jgi:PAS domain S-box-containing protein
MAEDITERKRAEEALQIERNKLEVVTRYIGAGLAIISKDYRTLWGNETLKRIFGDIEGKICYSTYNRKTEICSGCGVREVYEKGSDCAVHEQEREDIEGNTIWSEIIATPIKDKDGNITAALELVIPITERKWVEEELRRKSGEQALLLDNTQTQIWYLTDKETYGAVNKARAEFFGKKNEEMENKKLYDVLSKDEADICMSGYVEVFEKRKQIHTEEWITNAKGEKRLLSIIKSPKLNENGDIEYVVCSAEDITERKRTEEKVHTYQEQLRSLSSELSLIEERERRRIATDLHDHIGQALAFIKIKFGMLREMVSPLGHIDHIDEIQNLIEQAIHYTRSLTFELSPPVLYDLGFDAAVEWLVEQIQDQHHIQVDLEDDRQSKPMSDEIRISLFKAVRELLINIAKHAKAHKAKVSTRREDNTLRIIVEDDGVGFSLPEDKLLGKIAGYGLFSIRERLKHLGGSFEIESNLGCGTRVTLVAPLEQANNKGGIT